MLTAKDEPVLQGAEGSKWIHNNLIGFINKADLEE